MNVTQLLQAAVSFLTYSMTAVKRILSKPTTKQTAKNAVCPSPRIIADSVLIDGQNVIYGSATSPVPNLLNLLGLLLELHRRDCAFKCFFDAPTFYMLKSRAEKGQAKAFYRLCCNFPDQFIVTPMGMKADDYILDYSDVHATPIISNDRYREYHERYAWLASDAQRRIPFLKHSNTVQIVQLGINAMIPNDLKVAMESLHAALNPKLVTATVANPEGKRKVKINGVSVLAPA